MELRGRRVFVVKNRVALVVSLRFKNNEDCANARNHLDTLA
jgi:hypothetical protein